MTDAIMKEMEIEFDRIVNVLRAADSRKFPIVVIMGLPTRNELGGFMIGGSIVPEDRIEFLVHFLESFEKIGATHTNVKEGSGVN
jgi:hypothetical protein